MSNPVKSDFECVPEPAETPEPAVKLAHGTHFPFDWNGWGIGIEADPLPPVRTITDVH